MMTASPTLDRVLQSHQIGADDFILKPFKNLKIIVDKVQFFLGTPRKESKKENQLASENSETAKAEIDG